MNERSGKLTIGKSSRRILENGTVNGVHIGSQFTGPSHQIPSLPNWVYKKTSVRTFNCPGMSSNEWAKNRHQILKFLLGCRSLSHTKSLRTWHDIIKNTMWKTSSSEYSIPKLIEMLKLLKPRIAAFVYGHRLGTVNILKELQKTGNLIRDASNVVSCRRTSIHFDLSQVHLSEALELKFFNTIWNKDNNLGSMWRKKKQK